MQRRAVLFVIATSAAAPAFALYDPKPDAALAAIQGEWRGTLTYRDYQEPGRLVTLPTRLFVALGAPNELVLHYVFDDGPSKTVYSYEKMRFDVGAGEITWSSGPDAKVSVCRITADKTGDDGRTLVFERDGDKGIKRYTMNLSARAFKLGEDEVDRAGAAVFRNRFEFARAAA